MAQAAGMTRAEASELEQQLLSAIGDGDEDDTSGSRQ